MKKTFQFVVLYPEFANPPGRKHAFEESFAEYVFALGLDCGIGALGGGKHTYGYIFRPDGDVTENDRVTMSEWISKQPILASVTVGSIEVDDSTLSSPENFSGLKFEVQNLTELDRSGAEAHSKHVQKLFEQVQGRRMIGDSSN